MSDDLLVRPASFDDVERLADLATQLGYPASSEHVAAVLRAVSRDGDREVLVAESGGQVVGYAEVGLEDGLATDGAAQLRSLVFDERFRSRGIGARLVSECEAWSRARGRDVLRLRSNAKRHDAHRFYERLGFVTTKTSLVFSKSLQRPSSPGAPTARTS